MAGTELVAGYGSPASDPPGNHTQSYRTRHPLRVVAELAHWQGHAPEALKSMPDHLAQLREQGLDVIED